MPATPFQLASDSSFGSSKKIGLDVVLTNIWMRPIYSSCVHAWLSEEKRGSEELERTTTADLGLGWEGSNHTTPNQEGGRPAT